MLVLLTNLVSEAAASTTRHISETSLIIRKRYAPIISDMRFVLAIPAVPQLLLRSPQHMKLWTQLLASLQAFDPQYRQAPSLEHVEHEHDGWIGCFNFLDLCDVIDALCVTAAKSARGGGGAASRRE